MLRAELPSRVNGSETAELAVYSSVYPKIAVLYVWGSSFEQSSDLWLILQILSPGLQSTSPKVAPASVLSRFIPTKYNDISQQDRYSQEIFNV